MNKAKSPAELTDHACQTIDNSGENSKSSDKSDASNQTDVHDELNNIQNEHSYLIERIKNLYSSMNERDAKKVESLENSKNQASKMIDEITGYVKNLNKQLSEIDDEKRKLMESLEATKNDLKNTKESKTKLEGMYKLKCKSDLDKSAALKKLKINYEAELMKFRNEDNYDLVRYLEKQLSLKDIQLMEQSFELESWRSHDNTINSIAVFGVNGSHSVTSSFNQDINNSHNNFSSLNANKFNNSNNSLSKKVPVDILYTSDPDVVTSTVKV